MESVDEATARDGRALAPVGDTPWLRLARPGVGAVVRAAMRLRAGRLDATERAWIGRVEALRRELLASEAPIPGRHAEPRTVAGVVEAASMPQRHCQVLFQLVRARNPRVGLELGTSIGLSSCYQGAALAVAARNSSTRGRLVTLEGSQAIAELARRNHRRLGLDHVEVVTGRFQQELPRVLEQLGERGERLGWAFVDGDHREEPTLGYFERLAAAAEPGAILAFDDIRWSAGMRRAWTAIASDPRVAWATNTTRLGVVVLG